MTDEKRMASAERSRRWYAQNKERASEYAREYQKQRVQDKDRVREYHKEWYAKNKDRVRESCKEWRARNPEKVKQYYACRDEKRVWMAAYREDHPCVICGEDCLAVLDFHHTDPAEKKYTIAVMANGRCSLDELKAEIEKCVVMCSNCHRKLHAGILCPEAT